MASVAPRILLLAPITPAPTGNGLAMRAALAVLGLARAGELSTAVVPVAGPRPSAEQLAWTAARSARVAVVDPPAGKAAVRSWLERVDGRRIVTAVGDLPERARLASPAAGEAVLEAFGGARFDVVYVLRLYLAAVALPLLDPPAPLRRLIDADDDDAATLESIARLHELRGEREAAERARRSAAAYDRLASAVLPLFDRVIAAAPPDASSLARRHRLAERITTLPNVVVSGRPHHPAKFPSPARLLFVGNLDYLPNLDAAERLATTILPLIRNGDSEAQLDLVGSARGAILFGLGEKRGVSLHGTVPDLDSFYRQATAVVAPLRAGGGSRIKLLEAFAYGVPVVASPTAAAGLDVAHDRELLLAESDREIAAAASRLAGDPTLAHRLATAASAFVAAHHDMDRTSERLRELVTAKLPPS